MRKLLFLFVCALVSIGTWAENLTGGGSYTVSDGVVTFSGTTAGAIAAQGSFNFGNANRIKFDNTCAVNKADLEKFLQGNTYYVDLFDITNGTNTPMKIDDYTTTDDDNNADNIDMIIEAAVADMVTNGWQAKGIILPLNTGSGTTKMERKNAYSAPTFTEYAAYYRDSQKTAAIFVHDVNVQYNENEAVTAVAQPNFNTAATHLNAHTEVSSAEIYMVSTNNKNKINISSKVPTGATQIQIVNDELVYRETLADIYVEGTEGAFASAVQNTGLKSTPCNQLVVEGPILEADITAVNLFTDGPKVCNVRGVTGFTAAMLPKIANSSIEYLILPGGLTREDVVKDNLSSSLTNLEAAMSLSTDGKTLVAYLEKEGTLANARYFATGGSVTTTGWPAVVVGYQPSDTDLLESVTLSGNLNAWDLAANTTYVNEDGHYDTTIPSWQNPTVFKALNGEQGTITTLDLTYAEFATPADMNISAMGLTSLTTVRLPISSSMTTLNEGCLYNVPDLQKLCIPSNFTVIEKDALGLCGALTIITDSDDHSVFIGKNGESFLTEEEAFAESANTYTLSKNITKIETGAFQTRSTNLSDIYIMATTTPLCEKDAFAEGMYVGWQGFTGGDYPYCREKYRNGSILYTVLHYPAQGSMDDATYATMEKQYTDVTKVYTKKEQSGAVDANGRDIAWPTFSELRRVYAQASANLTWHDWQTAYDGLNEVNETASTEGKTVDNSITGETYDFDNYIGWHQFVLTMANYYEPTEKVVNEKIVRDYELAGLYTFCIPYNMTYQQVVEWLGVPKSTDKEINRLDGVQQDENIMPEIHQLLSVEREKGTGGNNNVVTFRLTKNLYNYYQRDNEIYTYYLDVNNAGSTPNIQVINAQPKNTETVAGNPITLVAGRPYVIKAYKRVNVVNGVDEYKISGQNIANEIMTRYGNKFELKQSAVENGLYEQLGDDPDATTLRFAIPYEGHKIQAMRAGGDGAYLEYTEDGKAHKYYYTMVGQYWEQPLPLYSIYMARGKWYRYTDASKNYKWDPYKCIVMATKEQVKADGDKHYGEGYRDADLVNIPNITGTDKLDSEFKLGYLDGRDDDDFENFASSKYVFAFDDGIVELDEEGNQLTDIKQLDGVDLTIQPDNCKVYNMSGQYVGKSLNGLGKGMYIVNGKKFVVK